MDYLDFLHSANRPAIRQLRQETESRLAQPKKGFLRFREPYEAIQHLRAKFTDFSSDAVTIGQADELNQADRQLVYEAMRAFMPWRKGPFNIFGIEIDSEWQSQRKWNRIAPMLPDLSGKVIADIGCNNGYYMFRTIPHQPKAVIGFEPFLQHYYCFNTLNQLAGVDNLFMEMMGVEQINLFPDCFDLILLMGIIYHRISPVEMLREIRAALRPGGTLILESQAIPGDEPVALFPESRYAKVPGTYFVPTAACLKNWLTRVGFAEVEIFCCHPMSNEEQRRTDWMTFESYSDFIDPTNPSLTVEGYPAPLRVFLKATNPG
ncbi:MAG: tRNA 5-methoxyuridine(34)/uridine 5-oxyacetic acid(34) synthase CmoB [Desulfobulbaceae bacterium]|nr:tRNA 5-methoxyuridine(34)/uridine 5-oxyacetic acid(34) synthase CmoB [Desulfobulbaceae bacterium]HIJ78147.1 tRNA 5-methoxyuridine(34)/uridine 5-oxyacetic acid(34) synthase CmoB [Deltaproteobacteria bacterium]